MAQDPIKVDQLQIEPGAAGTRLLDRNPATGELRFQDSVVTTPLNLGQLAGLRNIANVLVVGKSGTGAAYTTIQSALDTIPANSSASNPYLVLVMPGTYTETVNLVRDGVHLVGLGEVTLESALEATPDAVGADHTLVISAQLGTTPLMCHIEGLRITNAHTNKACVRIIGGAGSTLLSTGCRIVRCRLDAVAAAGNRALWASTAGVVTLEDSNVTGNGLSLSVIEEMGRTYVRNVEHLLAFYFRYEVGQPEPGVGNGYLHLARCNHLGAASMLTPAVSIDCDGAGVAEIASIHMLDGYRLQFSGTGTHRLDGCTLGVLSLEGTVSVRAPGTRIASLFAANANAELQLDSQRGSASFVATDTEAVVFDIPQNNALYDVLLELDDQPANDETPWVTGKLATGFTINFATNQTLNVGWKATR